MRQIPKTVIGIELNGIVRNTNKQILKYYKKDINKDFDDSNIDLNVNAFIETLPFKNKKERKKFHTEDYAFEINGSANCMKKGLMVKLNEWLLNIHNNPSTDIDLAFFSLFEHDILLQSTLFFLGKLGCRIRKTFFPINSKEVWDECDVAITNSDTVVNTKPYDKVCIFISNNSDNSKLEEKCDFVYKSIEEIIEDEAFITKVEEKLKEKKDNLKKKEPWFKKTILSLINNL